MPDLEMTWLASVWEEGFAARLDRLPHALLLRGPRGVGKLTLARRLAQALLCETPAAQRPCGRCDACRWFTAGSHPDFREITLESDGDADGESDAKKRVPTEIRIAQVRALDEFIAVSSHRRGVKVILVHPAETLNTAAASALLKTLEEPPSDTHFILVSHRAASVLPTILSRCEKIAVGLPLPVAAETWLTGKVENPALALAQTGGAPLLAAELDDAGWWKERHGFLTLLGAAAFSPLDAAESVRSLPVERITGWLQRWAYDLTAVAAGAAPVFNIDFGRELKRVSEHVSTAEAGGFYRLATRAQRAVTHPLNPQLFVEELLLAYAAVHGARGAA